MIPPPKVVEQALRDGHLTFDEIVDRHFRLEERAHRNSLQIIRTHRQTLVVKTFATAGECRHELNALSAANHHARRYEVPEIVAVHGRTLTTRTPPHLHPLGSSPGVAPTPARLARCADALASLHNIPIAEGTDMTAPAVNPGGVGVWILDSSPAARNMIQALQEPLLHAAIERLSDALATADAVLSHGDIRPANLLLARRATIYLIDWETAGCAPRWQDVGALIGGLVELAIHAGKGPPAPQAIRAVLNSYRAATGVQLDVHLLMGCAGLRLLHTAVEQAHQEWEVSAQTLAAHAAGRLFVLNPTRGALLLGVLGG